MYNLQTKSLGHFDVAVCGGGIAGVCAAVSAAREGAKTILIERAGSLGGTLTEGFMPQVLDCENKGGLVRELYDFMNERQLTCPRRGKRVDEQGKKIPGGMLDTEMVKYFFDKICAEAGVLVLYHSQVAAAEQEGEEIRSLLLTTECGNYTLDADVYIDASGNGVLADMVGCKWDVGDPFEGKVSPASMGMRVGGMPPEFDSTDNSEDKSVYAAMLLEHGIDVSAQQATVAKLPSLQSWCMSVNFEYDVMPDDILSLSRAVLNGRREVLETLEKHKKIPGYERLYAEYTSAHIGVREGRRIYGEYRLTDEDILEGRKFEDGICTVHFGVDVHKLKPDDTIECSRGYRTKPYHIPYRCLLPKGVKNLLLAGRCISGDFYPHASYRVMGNMAATGEAGGWAAACCVKENILPRDFDGKRAGAFMKAKGYEI